MACAGLLVIVLASATLETPVAVRDNTEGPLPSPMLPATATVGKPINLSLKAIQSSAMPVSETEIALPRSDAAQTAAAQPGISLGPLRTEFGGISGRHLHLATVKLEGVSVLGGSLGGSIDSRSARITLSWPTGN